MRKILLPLIILLFATASKAQYVNIPDSNFRNYLIYYYPSCFNAAKQMDTTCNKITSLTSLYATNSNFKSIEGIKYFKSLTTLNCDYSGLTSFPTLPNSLKSLTCNNCQALTTISNLPQSLTSLKSTFCNTLTSISSLPDSLTYFDCSYSNVTNWSTLTNSLKTLICSNNKFTTLPTLPNSLEKLVCNSLYLTSLPSLPSTLKYLECTGKYKTLPTLPNGLTDLICAIDFYYYSYYGISLTSLPTLPNSLKYLNCSGNALITSLPTLPNSLLGLNCSRCGLSNLQALPNSLTSLICDYNTLASLPTIINTSLDTLWCSNNTITSIPTMPSKVRFLDCSHNKINSIANLSPNLISLNCGYNSLTYLPTIPSSLSGIFNCESNYITAISFSATTKINELRCSNNKLTSLRNFSLDTSLGIINCSQNLLTSLTLPPMITTLSCYQNKLTNLPLLPNSLINLDCRYNMITTLATLPNALQILDCGYNQITALPSVLPSDLRSLNCISNNITSLPKLPTLVNTLYIEKNNIYCLPRLPKSLKYLTFDTSKVRCIPNSVSGLTYPICSATNNINGCAVVYPIIEGKVFFDQNANNIKDTNDLYRSKTRINLSNNTYTFTNDSGYYQLAPDTIGSFTISQAPFNYSIVSPSSKVFNFSTYDTIVTQNFAIQPTSIKDSLHICLSQYSWAARPGFDFAYRIDFKNAGTTNFGATTVSLNYDASLLNFNFAKIDNGTVINTGNSLVLNFSNFNYGKSDKFIAYFTVKTTVPIGTKLCTNAVISNGVITAIDTACATVRGSFDPNDKTATPELSTTQVAAGKKIDYTIRFQNTGTDTAFHVVIADTLDSKLDYNTLQMVATSHNCKTTIKNNVIFFEMRNIMLPDSNVNKLGSNGFIRFTMLPKSTVVAGDNIPNKAAIYFDYNAPVITNTAVTQIKNPLLPVRITNYELRMTNEKLVLNSWTTFNEINASHFVIQRSEDGRVFKSVGTVAAKGVSGYSFMDVLPTNYSLLTTIYYRLQIVDKDGSFSFSEIKTIRLNQLTDKQIKVYPNPATAMVSIDCNNAKQISIVDYLGRTIKQFNNPTAHQTINTKQLNKGIYVVKVLMNNGEVKTDKLIVE